jgi:hypothetical protein
MLLSETIWYIGAALVVVLVLWFVLCRSRVDAFRSALSTVPVSAYFRLGVDALLSASNTVPIPGPYRLGVVAIRIVLSILRIILGVVRCRVVLNNLLISLIINVKRPLCVIGHFPPIFN